MDNLRPLRRRHFHVVLCSMTTHREMGRHLYTLSLGRNYLSKTSSVCDFGHMSCWARRGPLFQILISPHIWSERLKFAPANRGPPRDWKVDRAPGSLTKASSTLWLLSVAAEFCT